MLRTFFHRKNFSILNKFIKPNKAAGPSLFHRCDLRVAQIIHSDLCPVTRKFLEMEIDIGSRVVSKELYLQKDTKYGFYDIDSNKLVETENGGSWPLVAVLVNCESFAPDETHNYQILVQKCLET